MIHHEMYMVQDCTIENLDCQPWTASLDFAQIWVKAFILEPQLNLFQRYTFTEQ